MRRSSTLYLQRGVCLSVVLGGVFTTAAVAAMHAVAEAGNICILRSNGTRTEITSSGQDGQPDLSLDEKQIVFVRSMKDGRSEVWIAHSIGGAQAQPLVRTPLRVDGRRFDHVFTPRFSPDGAAVYFLVEWGGDSTGILKAKVASPAPQFIAAAEDYRVVPTGKYRGHIVAQIHKAKLAPGYYDWYWLLTPDGKEVGVVGENELDVSNFLDLQ